MRKDEGLVRAVGVQGLSAGIVNYTVGAGIFVLPAVIAAQLGPRAPIAYIVCAVAMGLIVLCFAEAGSRVSLSGGTYAYAQTVFGPYVGFMVAMMLWFGANVLASATVATVMLEALGQLSPVFSDPVVRAISLLVLYGVLASINILGVRTGSRMVQGVTVAKLAPLLMLVVVGAFFVSGAKLSFEGLPSVGEIGRASAVLLFAFLGVEAALTPSGEVRDPVRTVPLSIFIALITVTILYLAIQTVALGVLGDELATRSSAPLAAVARQVLGRGGELLVLVGMAISTFGYVAGDMLAAPRGLFALGFNRLLPAPLGAVHPRYRTPHVAILVHAALCAGIAITGTFATLAALTVLATLFVYLVCCIATIELQRRDIRTTGADPFRVPGGPVIPVLATAVVLWLMFQATRQEVLVVAGMGAVFTVIYFLMRLVRPPATAASET